jgi:FixJ family two-component response regulator
MIWEQLTPAEVRVVSALVANPGTPRKELAASLGMMPSYFKFCTNCAMEKLGMFNVIELCIAWDSELFQIGMRELGLVPLYV